MLKKLVTLTVTTMALTVCVLVFGILSASAAQDTLSVKSINTTSTSATLTLSGSSKASYVSYSENKNFLGAKTVDAAGTTVKISGLKPETTYYFKAVPQSAKAVDTASDYITAKTEPVVSPDVDSSSIDISAVKVEFKKNAECSGYRMWIADNKDFNGEKMIQGVSTLKFDYLKPNTTYYLKAYAYVTINGSNYFSEPIIFTLKTKALPKTTVNYKTSNSATTAIRIEFDKVSGVNYKMRICADKSFAASKSRTVDGGSSLRFDNLAQPNHTYYIRAVTYKTINGVNYYSEPTVFAYKTKALPKTTVNYNTSGSTAGAVRIEFDKIAGVNYKMRICADKSFAASASRTVEGGSSLRFDNLMQPNHTYYIRAVTYKTVNGKRYYSDPIVFTYNTKALPKPTVNYNTSGSTGTAIRIEFNKISSVNVNYKMRICEDSSFAASKSRTVEGGSSLRFDNLTKPNHTYYIRAVTYKTVNGKRCYSEPIVFTYKTKPSPVAPTGVKVTNGMYQISWNTWGPQYTVSWDSVSGASSYNIYESSSRNGVYKKVGSTSKTTYTVTEPSIGNHYYIIKTVSGGVEGKASAVCGIRYVGMFSTTGYCANYGALTADGSYCASGHTVAAGYAYAFGTYFKIGDHGYTYEVEDRGGAVTNSVIDIYFDSYSEAANWGRRWLPVYQIL